MKKNLAFPAAVTAVMMSVLPLSAQAAIPQLNGMVVSSSDETVTGLYGLPAGAGGTWDFMFEVDSRTTAIYSGVPVDNVYYATRVNAQYGTLVYLDAFDMESDTKLWTNYLNSAEYLPYDLAFNPADGQVYGIFSNRANDGLRLCTVTYGNNTTAINVIKELDGYWVALACDAQGQLYGIRSEMAEVVPGAIPEVLSSSLYKLDRHTGDATLVGETGEKPLLSGSATIDTRSGRMFWTVDPDGSSSYLTEVDLATGRATKVMDFEAARQVVGLYAPVPLAEDDAPAAVTGASVSFPDGALTGTLTFTAPASLFDGTPASGALTYTVTLDGETVASGATSFGATENVALTVGERGSYTFMVSVANAAGPSPKVEVKGFAGHGTPAAPQGVKAVMADGSILVSWEAVTESVDGGYLDPAQVTYDVTRLPDGAAVASGLSSTSVSVPVDESGEMAAYSFKVVAVNGGVASEGAVSGNVVTGTPSLPWAETFDNASALDFFNIIDANDDGRTWSAYSGYLRVQYNSSLAMDDWLISPPLRLEGGRTYRVSFKAKSENTRYPERVEARWGAGSSVADMTMTLVEPVVPGADFEEFSGYMAPETSGTYFFGIHGISDRDCYYLAVDDVMVEAGINMNAPAAATDASAVADASGDYKATVSFTAPASTIGGAALASLEKVVILLDDEVVGTVSNPAPGAAATAQVELPRGGDLTLNIIAYNAAGAGLPAAVNLFVGVPAVKAPASVSMSETAPGQVRLQWEEVTEAADGSAVDPSRVRYNVYDLSSGISELLKENVAGTEHEVAAAAEGSQRFVQYAVAAVTEGGESEPAATAMLPVGEPYAGFAESFAGGSASTVIRFERINYGNWAVSADDSDASAQDGDNGFAVMNGYFSGYSGALYTGKIDLDGLKNPALRFYSYTPDNEAMDQNVVAVGVSVDGGEYTEVFRKTVVEMGASMGWHEVEVSLGDYVGKTVSLRFYAETYDRPYTATYIDNISVFSMEGIDLELASASAPVHVRAGDEFNISVSFRNKSAFEVSGHQLEVYADGELALVQPCDNLPAMGEDAVEIGMTMHSLAEEPISYTVAVRHEDDSRDDNDASAPFVVTPVVSALPAPEALTASRTGNEVKLAWTAPVLSTVPASAVTDDFESSLPWAHSAPGWVFADCDKAPVAAFGEVEVPGITPGVTHASFFTFSATGTFQGNRPLAAHSGTQYLAAFARYDAGLTDDWAISPELSGEAQTISFWAQSYDATNTWMEAIEVYWSEGSIDVADFVSAGFSKNPLPNGWAKYSVDLPAGARRFAIRSSSYDSFMLMVDDVTYQPLSAHNLTPLGFNVYRDMVKLNDAPLAAPSFTDMTDDSEAHSWVVTAQYEEGESRGSNVAQAGTGSIDSAAAASGIEIRAYAGAIVIAGAEGLQVTVSAPDGKLLFNAMGDAVTEVSVLPGVYVVKAGQHTCKIAVN